MISWRFLGGVAAGTAVLTLTTLPAAATVAADLCDPLDDICVITGSVVVDPSSVLNLSGKTIVLADKAKLTWSDNLTIQADLCTLEPKSKLIEAKESSGTGFLALECTASNVAGSISTVGAGVIIEGDGPHLFTGKLKAKGDQVGVIAIDSYGEPGGITVSGKMTAQSKVGTPPGEFRLWSIFGDVVVEESARINVKGIDADPFSEYFFFVAESGALTMNGKINTRNKTGAYALNFEADGDVSFGPKSKVQAKAKVTGAEVAINSQLGNVTLQGKIQAQVKETEDGARVRVCASNDIVLDGGSHIDASDKGFDSSIIIGAGNSVTVGIPDKGAKLTAKTDGDIEICGNTVGVSISPKSKIDPDPEAVGNGECLSPTSQVIFLLSCSQ